MTSLNVHSKRIYQNLKLTQLMIKG